MGKRILFGLVALVSFGIAQVALAADFASGQQATLPVGQTVNDDYYAAGGTVTIDGNVNGDVWVTGGQVQINGNVNGDINAVGGDVRVTGVVNGNARLSGGQVEIDGKITRDVFLATGSGVMSKDAIIGRDLYVGAGTLTIGGTTNTIHAGVGTLTIASTAKVNGDVIYTSNNAAKIDTGATMSGTVTQHAPKQVAVRSMSQSAAAIFYSMLVTILMGLLFIRFFPVRSATIASTWNMQFLANVFWGLLTLIVVPVLFVVLMMTIVGIPLGVGLLLLYPIILYLGMLVGTIAFGSGLTNLLGKNQKTGISWMAVVLGALVLGLISQIQIVGPVIVFLVFVTGLGALVRYDMDWLKNLHSAKLL